MLGTHVRMSLVAVFCFIALAGCTTTGTVEITYEPLANAKSMGFGATPLANRMYMTYCISRITNTAAGASNFQFDRNDLKLADSGDYVLTTHWASTVQNTVVPAGQSVFNLGTIVLAVDVTGMPDEGKYSTVNLLYKTTGTESVLMTKYPIPPNPNYKASIPSAAQLPVCFDGTQIP